MEIDNYENVMSYNYKGMTKERFNRNYYVLKDIGFSFADYSFELEQYPQGICFSNQYLFITSYSKEKGCLGELKVYDKKSGDYLITLEMDKESHLGGITFDGENIWVCNSSNMTIERLSYDFICLLAEQNTGEVLDVCDVVDVYQVSNVPSCITYYNGRLWIATHSILFTSEMVSYYFDKEQDELVALSQYDIPSQVQGIAFDEEGTVYFSTSYGRKRSSYIRKYNSLFSLIKGVENYAEIIEMPPCSEELALDNENLYVLFESATETYIDGSDGFGSSISPLDKILILPIENR